MTLHYPRVSRERILAVGIEGTGKTQIGLQIARACDDVTCWVIETDPSWERSLEDPEFEDLTNIELLRCRDWPATKAAIERVWAEAGRDDWIIFDNISRPWQWIRDWYWATILDEPRDEFLLRVRKAEIAALTGGKQDDDGAHKASQEDFAEWEFINPHYDTHVTQRLLDPPCHLYLTAWAKPWVDRFDSKNRELANLYESHGVKPAGQKETGRLTNTVLLLLKTHSGGYQMTTVKDRGGRVEFNRAEWTDFASDYMEEQGWIKTSTKATNPTTSSTSAPVPATTGKGKGKAKR